MSKILSKSSELSKKRANNKPLSTKKVMGATLAPPIYGIHSADTFSDGFIQTKLKERTDKKDKYEQEADKLSQIEIKNITNPSHSAPPPPTHREEQKMLRRKAETNIQVSELSPSEKGSAISQETAIKLNGKGSGGNSMDSTPRAQMEAAFGADFSQVRIHTDSEAVRMNQEIGAKAFTYGSNIFFNQGMYAPDAYSGKLLLAHELVHTLQQRSAQSIQRKAEEGAAEEKGIFSKIISFLEKYANDIPGYSLLSVITGYDLIRGERVLRTPENFLRGIMGLAPGGDRLYLALVDSGALDKAFDWLNAEIEKQNISLERIKAILFEVWEETGILGSLSGKILVNLKNAFIPLLTDLESLGEEALITLFTFFKETLIIPLVKMAEETKGYQLLTKILGKDPITGEKVERTGENLILGFLGLILPDDRIQEIQKSGVIQQTIDWVLAKVGELGMSWDTIVQLFMDIWNSVTIEDLIEPMKTFARIMAKFGEPIMKIIHFAKDVILKVVEVFLQIMQFPTDVAKSILEKFQQAYEDIKRDPVRFLINLLNAIKLGFAQFFENIGKHLLEGVKGWLFKQLEKAGITPPEDLSLSSILKLVMEVLDITQEKILTKIEKKIGKEKMDQLRAMGEKAMGIWSFINDILTDGPAAIWDKIQEKLSNLWEMVVGFVREWITENVVNKVITKLLSMLDPTGIMAVVNSLKALYDSIRSAIEYFTEMLEIVNSFVGGVAEIAKGSLNQAAGYLEGALGDGVPVAIGYLANLLGLDNLADKLREMLEKLRVKVDEAFEWLIDKADKALKPAMDLGERSKKDKDDLNKDGLNKDGLNKDGLNKKYDPEKAAKIKEGLLMIEQEEKKYLTQGKITNEEAEKVALNVKGKHSIFKRLQVFDGGESWDYKYAASPANIKRGRRKAIKQKRYLPKGFNVRDRLYLRRSGWASTRAKVIKRDESKRISRLAEILSKKDVEVASNKLKYHIEQGHYDEDVLKLLKRKNRLLNYEALAKSYYKRKKYEVDHHVPLAEHWYKYGYNSGDRSRKNHATDMKYNLILVTRRFNRSWGGLGYTYKQRPYVGPKFTSILAEGNKKNANTILDANNKKRKFRDKN